MAFGYYDQKSIARHTLLSGIPDMLLDYVREHGRAGAGRVAREWPDKGKSLLSIARSYNIHNATVGRLCAGADQIG